MGRHNSHTVTALVILAWFAAIVFPTAGYVRDSFHLNRWFALLIAIPTTAGIMWLLGLLLGVLIHFFMRDKTSETKK
ncbi:MAG TPA: hypothetical protein VM821_02000 [Abditibacteriaceae bacterium]|nr:hypothetical protein [Abditibacteriaceae bacterium]